MFSRTIYNFNFRALFQYQKYPDVNDKLSPHLRVNESYLVRGRNSE